MGIERAKHGDIVVTTQGKKYEFVRAKRKYFLGVSLDDGLVYNVPILLFDKILTLATVDISGATSLLEGDWFYIYHKGYAVLFEFIEYSKDRTKIIASNPATGGVTKMDISMFKARLEITK